MDFSSSDVICAPATPVGHSAIGVVRLSGEGAQGALSKIAPFLPEKIESHRVYYGFLKEAASKELLDEVLVTYFAKGRSYTGEASFEISCHGNPEILGSVMRELLQCGVRVARPGEFTFRAFMNGRIDLAKAEAVHALIQSESRAGTRLALRQLNGVLSEALHEMEKDLYGVLAQVEAGIDFSTEGLELWTPKEMVARILTVKNKAEALISSYRSGKQFTEGVTIAIVGEPNVGKSSLLNCLVGDDRAIVADVPGTTRDVVKESVEIEGVKVTFLDTAGIRDTADNIEMMGIERTRKAIRSSDWVFGVYDLNNPATRESLAPLRAENDRWLWIGNKADLVGQKKAGDDLAVSCLRSEELTARVFEFLKSEVLPARVSDSAIISVNRHHEALVKSLKSLEKAIETLEQGLSAELAAVDLQMAVLQIDEILGKRVDEGVIDRIFKDFCLGK